MPAKRTTPRSDRQQLLKSVTTPLSFFVLTLLIIEGTLGLVISLAVFNQPYKWVGFICMIGIFVCVVGYVAYWTAKDPTKLLYGKEEHSNPHLDESALKDQIEDLIVGKVNRDQIEALIISKVRPECLQSNPNQPP